MGLWKGPAALQITAEDKKDITRKTNCWARVWGSDKAPSSAENASSRRLSPWLRGSHLDSLLYSIFDT